MIVSIHQPQYWPWTAYFDKIIRSDIFVLLDIVQFQKNGIQNRNQIKTSQGKMWLTVPVSHKSDILIKDVKIANNRWQKKHWKSIKFNYSNAPYFHQFEGFFKEIYINKQWDSLCDLNIRIIRFVTETLNINTEFIVASDMKIEDRRSGSDLILEICKKLGANKYISGQGGKNYLSSKKFEKNGIHVEFQEYKSLRYAQQFKQVDFIPDLSILDLILNCGRRKSIEVIKSGILLSDKKIELTNLAGRGRDNL